MRASPCIALLVMATVACGGESPQVQDAGPGSCEPSGALPSTCNGLEGLCAKRYDEVVHLTTHNAFCTEDDDFFLPNQRHSIARQLEDGVRAFMLDTYSKNGEVLLCHGACGGVLGQMPLLDALATIREYLACHPAEVVTIIFESYATSAETAAMFAESGALDYVHVQPIDAPWPTLAEMIAADSRLVVFTDAGGGELDWYHDVWAYARETPYAASEPEDFECTGGRGPTDAGLLIFNHFLTTAGGSPALAEMVNHDPYLTDRIGECETELAQQVNFVTVDFYDIGDVVDAVAGQNGAAP